MFQEMVFWDEALLWKNHEKPVFMLRYLTIQEANGLLCVDLVYNKLNNVSEHKKHFPCWVTFRDFRSNNEWQESQQSPVLVGIAAHTFPCGKIHKDRLWCIGFVWPFIGELFDAFVQLFKSEVFILNEYSEAQCYF